MCKYLRGLTKPNIVVIGVSLGLDYVKLSNLRGEEVVHQMVHMWLNQQDDVIVTSGSPTMNSLMKALNDNGFKGHVNMIRNKLGSINI